MSLGSMMRFSLAILGVLVVAGALLTHRSQPAPDAATDGVVFVYFPSLCAAPRDASDCHEIPRPVRPAFSSMAACSAYADTQLRQENNPRIMASCMKQWEG